jgi:hypothetical protein
LSRPKCAEFVTSFPTRSPSTERPNLARCRAARAPSPSVPNLYKRPKPLTDRREGDTFEVIFRDETGKQRQKTLEARTVQRAIAEAEQYRTQIRRGEVLASSRRTVGEVAAEWFVVNDALAESGERSPRTVALYRQRYTAHISPVIGSKRIQEVRPEHIGLIFARQRKTGLKPWTISGTQTIISALFGFALSRGYVVANPLDRVARIERLAQTTVGRRGG